MAERPSAGPRQHHDLPLGEDDRADDGGEEQDRSDLERHQVDLEQRCRDGADDPARRLLLAQRPGRESASPGSAKAGAWATSAREPARGVAPERRTARPTSRPTITSAAATAEGPRMSELRVPQVEQHDHEEEQHHDRAGVDQHLDRGDELGVEQHVDGGQREHGGHQPERGAHRVALQDAERRRDHGDGGEDVEDCVASSTRPADRRGPRASRPRGSATGAARGRTRSGPRLYSEFSKWTPTWIASSGQTSWQ